MDPRALSTRILAMLRRPTLAGVLLVLVVLGSACSSTPSSTATTTHQATGVFTADSTVTGPITTGHIVEPLTGLNQNMPAYGYEEQEFFVSGTAHAFRSTSTPANGRWTVTPTTSAPYETRILVRRPSDPSKFNGTVVVEWLNVSEGESSPDWDYLNPMLMRDGYAYVGVTAQALAVNGGTPILGSGPQRQKRPRPKRTGSPSRIVTATCTTPATSTPSTSSTRSVGPSELRGPVLGGAAPSHVVAAGESQSAFYLTTYADAIQPLSHTFDGIFIHSRGGLGRAAERKFDHGRGRPNDPRIRTDLKVPVFMFETQTDMIELGYAAAQQPNTDLIRTWEVAGTSHADAYLVGPDQVLLGCTSRSRRSATRGGPGRVHRLRQVGERRRRRRLSRPRSAWPARTGRPRPRRARQRHRRGADSGRRRAHVDAQRGPASRGQRDVLAVRIDNPVLIDDIDRVVREHDDLRTALPTKPRRRDSRRLHPRRRPSLAARQSPAGRDPLTLGLPAESTYVPRPTPTADTITKIRFLHIAFGCLSNCESAVTDQLNPWVLHGLPPAAAKSCPAAGAAEALQALAGTFCT